MPDVNLWVALTVGGHAQHSAAKRWFGTTSEKNLAFCRITEMGLLRLLTNVYVMSGNPLSASEAWAIRDTFLGDPRITFIAEPGGFESHWRDTAGSGKVGPNFWTDAYLLALCASTNSTLVTFDRALARKSRGKAILLHG